MNVTIEGIIDTVFNEETVGANNFKKRVLWVKTEEQYSNTFEIQFLQHNTDLLDGLKAGERVRVTIGLNGKKNEKDGKERVFNSMNGFGISKL